MKLRILTNDDDWEGLYVDDMLVKEGHRIQYEDIINNIPGLDFKIAHIEGYFDEWGGRCPDKWEECFDKLE